MGIENKDFSEKIEDCKKSIDDKLQSLSNRVDNPYEKKTREIGDEQEELIYLEKQLGLSSSDNNENGNVDEKQKYHTLDDQYIDFLKQFGGSELSFKGRIKAYASITAEVPCLPKLFETFFADA